LAPPFSPNFHDLKILEPIVRETRHRTRVVGAFPVSQSSLNLNLPPSSRRQHTLVEQEIIKRGAEGPADERSRQSLRRRRA